MIRRFLFTSFSGSIAFVTSTAACCAHEGHGHTTSAGNSTAHYLTEPYHMLQFGSVVVAILVVGIAGLRWYFSSSAQQRSDVR
ncbi:MAG: hypothetical protein U0930_20230 [Pirellulales bacterium]